MRTRILLVSLALTGCYPIWKGSELSDHVDQLAADQKDLAKQQESERDALAAQGKALEAKEADLSARLDKLEKASRTSDADVGVQIQAVREDLAQLHGQVDEYNHHLGQLDQNVQQLGATTDEKLAFIKGPDALKQYQAMKEAKALKRPTDKAEYLKLADAKAASGDSALAQTLYTEWLQKWPKDPLAASAHLSLGKLQQEQNHHREALSEFGEIAKSFPHSAQAPVALLRSSDSFAALGMADASKLALQALEKDYPRSQEAKIAKKRLEKSAPPKKKGKR